MCNKQNLTGAAGLKSYFITYHPNSCARNLVFGLTPRSGVFTLLSFSFFYRNSTKKGNVRKDRKSQGSRVNQQAGTQCNLLHHVATQLITLSCIFFHVNVSFTHCNLFSAFSITCTTGEGEPLASQPSPVSSLLLEIIVRLWLYFPEDIYAFLKKLSSK